MKLHLRLPKLKMPKRRKKKLRATAVRRPMRASVAEYDEMAEPNMKLSRALLIVLVLHVVAVSGIIAFNAIKTRQGVPVAATRPVLHRDETGANKEAAALTTAAAAPQSSSATAPEIRRAHAVARTSEDAHKTYVVQKGESPAAIAKKFKVSYDALVALNHIDDPRKLKVGQKLLLPNKSGKGKKSEE